MHFLKLGLTAIATGVERIAEPTTPWFGAALPGSAWLMPPLPSSSR